MSAQDIGSALAAPAGRDPRPEPAGLLLFLGFLLVVAIGVTVGVVLTAEREQAELEALGRRVTQLAAFDARQIEVWAQEQTARADRIAALAPIVAAAAAADAGLSAGRTAEGARLAVATLTERLRAEGLAGARIWQRNGTALLMAEGETVGPPLARSDEAVRVFNSRRPWTAPLEEAPGGLQLRLFRPIPAPPNAPAPAAGLAPFVGVLELVVPVDATLAQALRPRPELGEGHHVLLVQRPSGRRSIVALGPDDRPVLVPLDADTAAALPAPGTPLAAGPRAALTPGAAGADAFSAGLEARDSVWLVVHELTGAAAFAALEAARLNLALILGLATALTAGVLAVIWYRQRALYHRTRALEFKEAADRIELQRRLLESVLGSIDEWVGLKRVDGSYAYVNRAFAEALELAPARLVGASDGDLFPPEAAATLARLDDRAVADGSAAASEELTIAGHVRPVDVTKVAVRREDGRLDGIVTVARDVSLLHEQRRLRESALKATIRALVKGIELTDPYLAGHSDLVREFAIRIGRDLGLRPPDLATLETAASLAQLGKMFVPREIVTKPGRLTEAEMVEMRRHIGHAEAVLADVDFQGLPVREAIGDMYERLDGQGYPRGLRGAAISLHGRILGVADYFAARIRPRGYRDAIDPAEAVRVLEQNAERYDPRIVRALARLVASREGADLIAAAPIPRAEPPANPAPEGGLAYGMR